MKKLLLIIILYIPIYGSSQGKYDSIADRIHVPIPVINMDDIKLYIDTRSTYDYNFKPIAPINKFGWSFGFGYTKIDPFAMLDFSYQFGENQITINGKLEVNGVNPLTHTDIVELRYGRNLATFQPYVGIGNKGLGLGISKYFDNAILTAGLTGEYMHISLSAGNLKGGTNKGLTNNDWAIFGLELGSGIARGIREAIQAGHIGYMDEYWRWKYKNGDPAQGEKFWGSTTIFVSTIDPYHRWGTISNAFHLGTLIVSLSGKEKLNFKTVAKKVGLAVVGNTIGFFVGYKRIGK